MLAAQIDVIELLSEKMADVNLVDKYGMTALHVAVSCLKAGAHKADIVKLLLRNGANVHAKNWQGEVALSLAATIGDQATIKLLLTNKDVSATNTNKDGWSVLHVAVQHGCCRDIVDLFRNVVI